MKKNLLVLVVVALVFSLTSNAQDAGKKFKGTWSYECLDAPYGYNNGTMVIKENGGKVAVDVILEDGNKIKANSVKVQEGVLSFKVSIEDSNIPVELKKDGLKLVGKSYNEYGEELKITAKKKK